MARIFLSYARDDANRAEGIASSLEAVGHEAWWDRNIGAGESFSSEIDAALAAADLVVVLWSKHSIRSDWVRDEAAAGRDSGRLVPVLIDRVDPPLGFRQYQSVSLVGRPANHSPLLEAVGRKLGKGPAPARTIGTSTLPRRLVLIGAIIAIIGLLASGWWLLRPGGDANSIAVVASSDDAPSRDLARALTRDFGRIQAGPLGQFSLVDDRNAAARAVYRLEVAASSSGNQAQADLALKQHGASAILWSAVIEQPTSHSSDLRLQAAGQVGDVLVCLAEMKAYRSRISPDALALYLRGCARDDPAKALAALKELTRRASEFGPGWAHLALVSALQMPVTVAAERKSLMHQARSALDRAKELAPDFPETAIAESHIMPSGGRKVARALMLIERALEAHPESPSLHNARSEILDKLGRMRESIVESERAFALNPLSPSLFDRRVSALAYGGRPEAAFAELEGAERRWPGSMAIADVRFRLNLRFGDPKQALEQLEKEDLGGSPEQRPALQAFLEARADPSPAKIEAALEYLRKRYRRNVEDVVVYLGALVTFGRLEEAYKVVEPDLAADSLSFGTEMLFRPYMATFRADPRFMTLAKRMGFVEAWERTGVWPDFCDEPGLAYDCREIVSRIKHIKDVTEAAARLP